jgi:hypothetical protein
MVDEIDETYVRELVLAATNDRKMYLLAQMSITALQKKIRTGRFNANKATKIFQNVYLEAARAYYEQMTGFTKRMTKAEKDLFCKLVYEHYSEEIFGIGNISTERRPQPPS